MIKTLFVCGGLILGIYLFLGNQLGTYRKQIAQMTEVQGVYADRNADQIETEIRTIAEKLNSYKKVSLKSNVAFYLNHLPKLLPEGTWLKTIDISSYTDPMEKIFTELASKISMEFEGYAYHPNRNQQIKLVNSFIENIKSDKKFSQIFENVYLVTAQTQEFQSVLVTSFRIDCR